MITGYLFILIFGFTSITVPKKSISAIISGKFNNCSEASCTSSLTNRCAADNNGCKCEAVDSSSCGTLNQHDFVTITGAVNESSSGWICCYCSRNESYCCDKCRGTSASPNIVLPTTYFRIIMIFLVECKKLERNNDLKSSLTRAIVRWTGFPLERVTVKAINCTTGQQPFCGVDVENLKMHARKKRAVGGRMKGTNTKKKKNNKVSSFSSYDAIDLTCEAILTDIKVSGKNLSLLERALNLLRHLQENNSLSFILQDGQVFYSSFMLSAVDGSMFSYHQAPTTEVPPLPPTYNTEPLTIDLMPLIYAAGSILGLVTLCVVWQFIKHSWLLYRKRFTPINSDRVDHKKVKRLQLIREAMEENDIPTQASKKAYEPASGTAPRIGNEATTQQHNWSSAKSLAPAYEPTELHNKRTPPTLILDDPESDIEKRSIDGEDMANSADDENISDILNSDEERVLRPSSGRSSFLRGLRNVGFRDEDDTFPLNEVDNSKMRKKSISEPRVVNGDDHGKLNISDEKLVSQRKASLVSSNSSIDPEETTVILPLKPNKNPNKRQEPDTHNKGNMLLSPQIKKFRRVSITSSLDEDNTELTEVAGKRRKNSSLPTHDPKNAERRKPVSANDNQEVMVVAPKDIYTNRGKDKVSTFENDAKPSSEAGGSSLQQSNRPRRSTVNEWGRTETSFGQNRERARKNLSVQSAAHGKERRKSFIANREGAQMSDNEEAQVNGNLRISVSKAKGQRTSTTEQRKGVKSSDDSVAKISDGLAASKQERKKSIRIGEEFKTFGESGRKGDTRFNVEGGGTPLAGDEDEEKEKMKQRRRKKKGEGSAEDKISKETGKAKRKKKKPRKEKEDKKKVDDSDGLSDVENALTEFLTEDFKERRVETPATPENNSVATSEEKEPKKKKKKRKGKKVSRRKWKDSEESEDDVEGKIN
ncbi:uncharacterized protein [Montipora foliosa]|uniref:uncharacterized protein n=1 Tax=Montipora foliosa TaxID=591990 RepID=UPI0035F1419A